LEWSYFNEWDIHFDGPSFLSNYDNIQKSMSMLKKYNIFNNDDTNKYKDKKNATN